MDFKTSKKRQGAPAGVCSFCAQDIARGERIWRCCGLTSCEDCFALFARLELKAFEEILGEESEL